jgi:PII-like signaling protein
MFGAHGRLHTWRIEGLSEDLPIVVELVDTREIA